MAITAIAYNCLVTDIFLGLSSFVLNKRKKLIPVRDNLRVSKL